MNNSELRRDEREFASEPRERLTTKDVAAGAAPKQAREEVLELHEPVQSESPQPGRDNTAALFEGSETEKFRSDWNQIQTQFVDEPRRSVEQADELVAQTMKRLAEIFAAERENLEREWDRGDDVSTEDLRIALQRCRSFFDRLLTV